MAAYCRISGVEASSDVSSSKIPIQPHQEQQVVVHLKTAPGLSLCSRYLCEFLIPSCSFDGGWWPDYTAAWAVEISVDARFPGVFTLTAMELRKDPITRSWVITGDEGQEAV